VEAQEIFLLAKSNTVTCWIYSNVSVESSVPMYTLQGICCNAVKKQYWMTHKLERWHLWILWLVFQWTMRPH